MVVCMCMGDGAREGVVEVEVRGDFGRSLTHTNLLRGFGRLWRGTSVIYWEDIFPVIAILSFGEEELIPGLG